MKRFLLPTASATTQTHSPMAETKTSPDKRNRRASIQRFSMVGWIALTWASAGQAQYSTQPYQQGQVNPNQAYQDQYGQPVQPNTPPPPPVIQGQPTAAQTQQYQAQQFQGQQYQAQQYQGQQYQAQQPPNQQYFSSPAPQPTTPNRVFATQPPSEVTFPPTRFGPRGERTIVPGPASIGAGNTFPPIGTDPVFTTPNVRVADLIVNGFPARTGRIMFGGAVNSDAGVTGQVTIDERNFDISRWPRSFRDLFSGTAFRGAGQTFRAEAAPGSDFDRYSLQFADPNLFGYLPISFSVSGFLYDRRFRDWDENRLGGRLALGYRITPDLSVSAGISGQRVRVDNIRVPIAELSDGPGGIGDGDNGIYSASLGLTHNTRDSPIQPSQGHFMQLTFEQAFGDFDYPRLEFEYRKYWLLASRADNSGKQTLSYSTQLGISGNETPIYEHFFAGGYATLRGFDFRGAGPVISGVEAGGEFQWLNSVEYMFPITADDAFRGVLFCDFGTVEEQVELESESFRVAPGFGLRVAIPALGPAPLAFDFAYPVNDAPTDDRRVFSFYMSLVR
ncbi:MAG: BamA/TamA family outer membrane protein [Planctomycetota bacterium]